MIAHDGAAADPLVLRPEFPSRSRAGRLLVWLGVPWAIGVLVSYDAIVRSEGLAYSAVPILTRAVIVAIAALPLLVWLLGAFLGPRTGLAWQFEHPQPSVRLDSEGIELVPGSRSLAQRFRWEDVGGLAYAGSNRFLLLDTSGTLLTDIPVGLVSGRDRATGRATSLAAAVVRTRPDRYVLTAAGRLSANVTFRLRTPADAPAAPEEVRFGNWRFFLIFTGLLVLIGGVLLVVLFVR